MVLTRAYPIVFMYHNMVRTYDTFKLLMMLGLRAVSLLVKSRTPFTRKSTGDQLLRELEPRRSNAPGFWPITSRPVISRRWRRWRRHDIDLPRCERTA